MAIELPKVKIEPKSGDPKFLVIFGKPKTGKSTICSQLENNLIIDTENGYDFLHSMKVNVKTFDQLCEVIEAISNANKEAGKNIYKYITIDNGTNLEDILLDYALLLYRKTPMGKDYTGDVMDLPNGAGYKYTRDAMKKTIKKFKELCDTLILVCHTSISTINRDGKELSEMTLDLVGKNKQVVTGDADAVCYMYRKRDPLTKTDVNILNFRGGGDQIVEARQEHLRNREIVIAQSDENGVVTTNWDKIFLEVNK